MADNNAYTNGFSHDIFISYAHADNIPLAGQQTGWISQLHKELDILLSRRWRPGAIKFWWDNRRLDGSTAFDQSIANGINGSAIFLCLTSHAYMQSDYCRKELDLFYQKAKKESAGLLVSDRSRIVNVRLSDLPHTEWPEPLQGATGFSFFDAGGSDPLDIGDAQSRTKIQELRNAIVGLLSDFPQQASSANGPMQTTEKKDQEPTDENAFTIYFGDVPDSLRTLRKRTINELEKSGYRIVCDVPPPYEAEAHEKAVIEKVSAADLSVHLLDQFPGREIDNSTNLWYPQKQAELGLQSAKAPLIWVPSDLAIDDVEEEAYKQFLQSLDAGMQSAKAYDYIRGIKGELPQQIIGLAESLKAKRTAAPQNGKLSVLLDAHTEDQKYAWELGTSLLQHQIQPILNPLEESPRENGSMLSERIGQANKLVFFYGKVDWLWVQRRVNAAMKLVLNNDYPADEFFVFLVPPHKNPSEVSFEHRFLKVNVINNSDAGQLDQDALQQFLKTVKAVA